MRTSVSVVPPTWSVPLVVVAVACAYPRDTARAAAEPGPKVITVEYDAGARGGAGGGGGSGGLLRREPHRDAAQEQQAFHYGRLKMMTMPLVTDTIDGSPRASGVR